MPPPAGNALEPFARELLDALDAHVAVLDARGTIVAVNDPWRRFAVDNAGALDATGPGANYVDVCAAAVNAGEESAREMLHSIRDVLSGMRDSFTLEYPCHSPACRRWFLARGKAFRHGGSLYVAMVHEDITARMIADEQRLAVQAELEAVLAREREKARTDELTGLFNRRHFFELAEQLAEVARRYGSPFSILMFDLDHFKRVNDRFGHQFGDGMLQCVARMAREQMRAADVLARYGGEEFIVALPLTRAQEALAAAEKLRESVKGCGRGDERDPGITLSAGVAQMASVAESLEDVIRRADAALYAAKREGRNRSKLALPLR